MTPAQRSLRARMAVLKSWANTADPSARTAPGRAAQLAKWEREVDPDGALPEADRRRRAEYARRSYMLSLAAKSVQARAARKAGR